MSSSSDSSGFLYFDPKFVIVDWEDGSFDAASFLHTNFESVSWDVTDPCSVLDGLVTFGEVGQLATVNASANPSDSLSLLVMKVRIKRTKLDQLEPEDVTDQTLYVLAGEPITLYCSSQPAGLVTGYSWNVPPTAIADYFVTSSRGFVTNFNQFSTDSAGISIYYLRSGVYNVTLTARLTLTEASTVTKFVTVVVQAPNPPSFAINLASMSTWLGSGNLYAGYNAEAGEGLTITPTPPSPEVPGEYGWFQIIDDLFLYHYEAGPLTSHVTRSAGFDGWAIPAYPGEPFTDGPSAGMPQANASHLIRFFSATTFYMYKSAVLGSIWVPVKSVRWGFFHLAKWEYFEWKIKYQQVDPFVEDNVPNPPEWSAKASTNRERLVP